MPKRTDIHRIFHPHAELLLFGQIQPPALLRHRDILIISDHIRKIPQRQRQCIGRLITDPHPV